MILDAGDVQLSYFVSGEGAPVTFLHGFTQSAGSWGEVIGKLPEQYRCIAPDLRGHGATTTAPGAPCSMEACTADLELLWDHLGVERTHLVGYSMGGRLALHVAARRPERILSLLTIGAHAGLDEGARGRRRLDDEALASRIENEGVDAFVTYWGGLPLLAGLERRGPAFVEQLRAERLKNRAAGLACSLRGMGAGVMQPVWDDLGGVPFPCTFVAGELDQAYAGSASRLAAAVPRGRVDLVAGAGHPVHQERPDAFVRVLAAHLAAASSAVSSSSSTAE